MIFETRLNKTIINAILYILVILLNNFGLKKAELTFSWNQLNTVHFSNYELILKSLSDIILLTSGYQFFVSLGILGIGSSRGGLVGLYTPQLLKLSPPPNGSPKTKMLHTQKCLATAK